MSFHFASTVSVSESVDIWSWMDFISHLITLYIFLPDVPISFRDGRFFYVAPVMLAFCFCALSARELSTRKRKSGTACTIAARPSPSTYISVISQGVGVNGVTSSVIICAALFLGGAFSPFRFTADDLSSPVPSTVPPAAVGGVGRMHSACGGYNNSINETRDPCLGSVNAAAFEPLRSLPPFLQSLTVPLSVNFCFSSESLASDNEILSRPPPAQPMAYNRHGLFSSFTVDNERWRSPVSLLSSSPLSWLESPLSLSLTVVRPAMAAYSCGADFTGGTGAIMFYQANAVKSIIAPRYQSGGAGGGGPNELTECKFDNDSDIRFSLYRLAESTVMPSVISLTVQGGYFLGTQVLFDLYPPTDPVTGADLYTAFRTQDLVTKPFNIVAKNNIFQSVDGGSVCGWSRLLVKGGVLPFGSNVTLLDNTFDIHCTANSSLLWDFHIIYFTASLISLSTEVKSYMIVRRNVVRAVIDGMVLYVSRNASAISAYASAYTNAVWDVSHNNVSLKVYSVATMAVGGVACTYCMGTRSLFIMRHNSVTVLYNKATIDANIAGVAMVNAKMKDLSLVLIEQNTVKGTMENALDPFLPNGGYGRAPLPSGVGLQGVWFSNGSKALVLNNSVTLACSYQAIVTGGAYTVAGIIVEEPIGVGSSLGAYYVQPERLWLPHLRASEEGRFEGSSALGPYATTSYISSPSSHPLSASATVVVARNYGAVTGMSLLGGTLGIVGGMSFNMSSSHGGAGGGGDTSPHAATSFVLVTDNKGTVSADILDLFTIYGVSFYWMDSVGPFAFVVADNAIAIEGSGKNSLLYGVMAMGNYEMGGRRRIVWPSPSSNVYANGATDANNDPILSRLLPYSTVVINNTVSLTQRYHMGSDGTGMSLDGINASPLHGKGINVSAAARDTVLNGWAGASAPYVSTSGVGLLVEGNTITTSISTATNSGGEMVGVNASGMVMTTGGGAGDDVPQPPVPWWLQGVRLTVRGNMIRMSTLLTAAVPYQRRILGVALGCPLVEGNGSGVLIDGNTVGISTAACTSVMAAVHSSRMSGASAGIDEDSTTVFTADTYGSTSDPSLYCMRIAGGGGGDGSSNRVVISNSTVTMTAAAASGMATAACPMRRHMAAVIARDVFIEGVYGSQFSIDNNNFSGTVDDGAIAGLGDPILQLVSIRHLTIAAGPSAREEEGGPSGGGYADESDVPFRSAAARSAEGLAIRHNTLSLTIKRTAVGITTAYSDEASRSTLVETDYGGSVGTADPAEDAMGANERSVGLRSIVSISRVSLYSTTVAMAIGGNAATLTLGAVAWQVGAPMHALLAICRLRVDPLATDDLSRRQSIVIAENSLTLASDATTTAAFSTSAAPIFMAPIAIYRAGFTRLSDSIVVIANNTVADRLSTPSAASGSALPPPCSFIVATAVRLSQRAALLVHGNTVHIGSAAHSSSLLAANKGSAYRHGLVWFRGLQFAVGNVDADEGALVAVTGNTMAVSDCGNTSIAAVLLQDVLTYPYGAATDSKAFPSGTAIAVGDGAGPAGVYEHAGEGEEEEGGTGSGEGGHAIAGFSHMYPFNLLRSAGSSLHAERRVNLIYPYVGGQGAVLHRDAVLGNNFTLLRASPLTAAADSSGGAAPLLVAAVALSPFVDSQQSATDAIVVCDACYLSVNNNAVSVSVAVPPTSAAAVSTAVTNIAAMDVCTTAFHIRGSVAMVNNVVSVNPYASDGTSSEPDASGISAALLSSHGLLQSAPLSSLSDLPHTLALDEDLNSHVFVLYNTLANTQSEWVMSSGRLMRMALLATSTVSATSSSSSSSSLPLTLVGSHHDATRDIADDRHAMISLYWNAFVDPKAFVFKSSALYDSGGSRGATARAWDSSAPADAIKVGPSTDLLYALKGNTWNGHTPCPQRVLVGDRIVGAAAGYYRDGIAVSGRLAMVGGSADSCTATVEVSASQTLHDDDDSVRTNTSSTSVSIVVVRDHTLTDSHTDSPPQIRSATPASTPSRMLSPERDATLTIPDGEAEQPDPPLITATVTLPIAPIPTQSKIEKASNGIQSADAAVILAGGAVLGVTSASHGAVVMAVLRVSKCIGQGDGDDDDGDGDASNADGTDNATAADGASSSFTDASAGGDSPSSSSDDNSGNDVSYGAPLPMFVHPLHFALGPSDDPYRYLYGATLGNVVIIPLALFILLYWPIAYALREWAMPRALVGDAEDANGTAIGDGMDSSDDMDLLAVDRSEGNGGDGEANFVMSSPPPPRSGSKAREGLRPPIATVRSYLGLPHVMVLPYAALCEGMATVGAVLLAAGSANVDTDSGDGESTSSSSTSSAVPAMIGIVALTPLVALALLWLYILVFRLFPLPLALERVPFEGNVFWWLMEPWYAWGPRRRERRKENQTAIGLADCDVAVGDAVTPSTSPEEEEEEGKDDHAAVEETLETWGVLTGDKSFLVADYLAFICALIAGIIEGAGDAMGLVCMEAVATMFVLSVLQGLLDVTATIPAEWVVHLLMLVLTLLLASATLVGAVHDDIEYALSEDAQESLGLACNVLAFFGTVLGIVRAILRLITTFQRARAREAEGQRRRRHEGGNASQLDVEMNLLGEEEKEQMGRISNKKSRPSQRDRFDRFFPPPLSAPREPVGPLSSTATSPHASLTSTARNNVAFGDAMDLFLAQLKTQVERANTAKKKHIRRKDERAKRRGDGAREDEEGGGIRASNDGNAAGGSRLIFPIASSSAHPDDDNHHNDAAFEGRGAYDAEDLLLLPTPARKRCAVFPLLADDVGNGDSDTDVDLEVPADAGVAPSSDSDDDGY